MSFETYRKKLYDQTAAAIASLHMHHRLDEKEMKVLLDLLDKIYLEEANQQLIEALGSWMNSSLDEEANQMIYHTFLNTEFEDEDSISQNAEIIQELLHYYQSKQHHDS